jgi:hypothetical protein
MLLKKEKKGGKLKNEILIYYFILLHLGRTIDIIPLFLYISYNTLNYNNLHI